MKKIKLTQGKFALVDNEDFEYLNQFKWYLQKGTNTFYAVRITWNKVTKKAQTIGMHREILNFPVGFEADHKDRNGLNNQRRNLRIATKSQNSMNTSIRKTNSSGIKGIVWDKNRNKWEAYLYINYKKIHLGRFDRFEIAILARKWGERLYFGRFASI